MTTKHTPEPWNCNSDGDWAVYGSDNTAAFDDGSAEVEYSPVCTIETRDRIMACVNACAGIADPANVLRLAREALKEVRDHCYDKQDAARCRALATDALAALTPEQEA